MKKFRLEILGYVLMLVLSTLLITSLCSFNYKTTRASWYGPGFNGKVTANGEYFNQDSLTAASPTIAFNSLVEVTNIANGKTIVVRVNDRGPFKKINNSFIPHPRRKLDLSKASFDSIANLNKGVIDIQYKIIN